MAPAGDERESRRLGGVIEPGEQHGNGDGQHDRGHGARRGLAVAFRGAARRAQPREGDSTARRR